MTPESTKLLQHEALVGGVVNTLINSVIAWLLLRAGPNLVWEGASSFVIDIIATAFILPTLVALIVIPLQRSKLAKGSLAPLALSDRSFLPRFAARLPRNTFLTALLFGLLGTAVVAPLTLFGLYITGVQEFTPQAYAVFKGVWAGLMAATLVLPILAYAHRPDLITPTVETQR